MNANYVVRAVFFRYYPLRVSISPSAAAVYTNHPVTFVANISDGWWSVTISFYLNGTYTGASGWLDNTPEYNYTISPQPTLPGGQITWNFTPTSAGVYFINAYAEDSWPCGAWAFGSYLVVQDLPPVHSPVAAFTVSPQELCQHDSVFFNASGSMPGFDGDSECPISEYVWDFGDGYSGTNRTVAHVYDQTGNYTVTLTVRAAGIPYVDPQYIETNSTSMKIQIIQEPPLGDGTSLTGGGGAGACRLM
jgi:PKD repeat protein